jgi:hypothetical protein
MRHFVFIYADSCDYICYASQSYEGAVHLEEKSFPKGTSDWEIVDSAKLMEIDRKLRGQNCASENIFTRKLARFFEIARVVDLE